MLSIKKIIYEFDDPDIQRDGKIDDTLYTVIYLRPMGKHWSIYIYKDDKRIRYYSTPYAPSVKNAFMMLNAALGELK